jgi:hypothetical protein
MTTSSTGSAAHNSSSRKDPIEIGVIYTPGVDQAASAVGIKGLSTGDTRAQAEALVAWMRAHGGLGGHPITTYDYAFDTSASSADIAWQEACTAMTQDHKVRYVVTILVVRPVFMSCLAIAGVGLLDDESNLSDAQMTKYASVLGNPGEIASGRMLSIEVDDLWRRGWLTPTSKVGILALDSDESRAVTNGALASALRRHGLTSASTQYISTTGGDGGSGQSSSAALQFRAAGVDRVISVLYSPLYMMLAASSQHYAPAYALSSNLGPGALLETAAPKDQLANAAGIGWQPYLDIGAGTKPGPVSSRETLCFDIMAKAGQATSSATAKGFQAQICNVLFYLKDLADGLPEVPRDLLTSGRALLKASFKSADTFRTDVTNRTDGVAGYRSLAYQQDCSCFQYVSPVQATP